MGTRAVLLASVALSGLLELFARESVNCSSCRVRKKTGAVMGLAVPEDSLFIDSSLKNETESIVLKKL